MQKNLPMLDIAQIKQLTLESPLAIKGCPDGAKALRMTVSACALSQEDLAKEVGTNKRSISRAMKGSCGLSVDVLIQIMRETRSVFLLQYMCRQMGGEFKPYTAEDLEMQNMKERMAELEARRAA